MGCLVVLLHAKRGRAHLSGWPVCVSGLSGYFGFSGGASDPTNKSNETDKIDHPARLASQPLDRCRKSVSSLSPEKKGDTLEI